MAWEKRSAKSYFYRSVRRGGQVCKVYLGSGPAAQIAAAAHALANARRRDEQAAASQDLARLENAIALNLDLHRWCELLAGAALLLAGYHRPSRHEWRPWRDGRKALRQLP